MHHKKCLLPNMGIVKAMLSVLAGTLLFTGCSRLAEYGKSNSNSNSNSNTQPQQAATPAPPGQIGVSTAPGPPTGSVPVSAGPAIATADGDKPGIRVEVVELKRTSGNTVNIKFAMINDSDKDMHFTYEFGEGSTSDYGTVAGTHLIDAEGKKKYFVVRDTEGACACSRGLKSIDPKTRTNLWAKFPAPPDDVQKITVVIPHFTPMDDVPISR